MKARLAPDLLSGVGFLAFNLAVGAGGINLGVGSVAEPGPGMYPLVLACAGVGLSIALAIGGLKPAATRAAPEQPAMAANWGAAGVAMLALTIYALLLPVFGIAVPSVMLMAVLFWMGGMRNLPMLVALALGLGIGADIACRLMGIPPPEPMILQLIGGA